MWPQLLLKNHSRTRIAGICAPYGLGTPGMGAGRGHGTKIGDVNLKRIGKIDGKTLFELALQKENILLAIDNASKDHAHDPQVI